MTSLLLLKSMLLANALQKSKSKKKGKKKNNHKIKKTNFSMCRVCNDNKGNISIFNNIASPDLPDEIKNFSGVTVSETDNLSKTMCQNCMDLLNGCIMFREICQSTNEKLLQLSKQKVSEISVKTKNYKEPDSSARNRIVVWAGSAYDLPKKKVLSSINPSSPTPAREPQDDSDDDYNIPSPVFSDDISDVQDYSTWSCTRCRQGFNNLASYNYHLTICKFEEPSHPEDKRKFLCDVCGKTTTAHAGLLVHMSTHLNHFPFKCDVCPYRSRTADLLRVHKRSHMADTDKPFKCTQCPKATTTSSNLAKHMLHMHSTARPFKCTYCDKGFSRQHETKKHIRETHLRQATVECDICYKNFNTKKILRGHKLKVHKIKGIRSGRMPSYLLYQQENANNEAINNTGNEYEAEIDRRPEFNNEDKS